jgi:prolyl 4-hydroxylase
LPITLFSGFCTAAECAYLIATAEPLLTPSVVVDPRTGAHRPDRIRTSDTAFFPIVDENPAIHAINRRIAAASGTAPEQGEPLQVLRYAPGQEYRMHSDALPPAPGLNQRILTFLIYLNDDYDGGATAFETTGLALRPRAGDAVLFRNTTRDGRMDARMRHAGQPVTKGVKYLASRWIRARPLL